MVLLMDLYIDGERTSFQHAGLPFDCSLLSPPDNTKAQEPAESPRLYDASYFGHAHLVRYLLQQKGNPDTAVKFQDPGPWV